jgi:hypothetical protein
MEFGQIINPTYDPSKNYMYKAFYEYFNNPTITKIKDVNDYSVYMTRIYALLGNAYRYLILFITKNNNEIGEEMKMSECEWIVLQTRTLDDFHKLVPHKYTSRRYEPLNKKMVLENRDENKTIYNVEEFPISVTLLNTRKNNIYQYNKTGTIISALETYQTIINIL